MYWGSEALSSWLEESLPLWQSQSASASFLNLQNKSQTQETSFLFFCPGSHTKGLQLEPSLFAFSFYSILEEYISHSD